MLVRVTGVWDKVYNQDLQNKNKQYKFLLYCNMCQLKLGPSQILCTLVTMHSTEAEFFLLQVYALRA
jgi:hypothetical protein